MSKLLATFFCITAMLLSPTHSIEISKAAEITAHEFIRSCKSITYIVTIEGSIVGGDAEKLSSNLMGRSVTSVLLNSPGGDVLEAMKISELLNHRIITATAPIDLRKEHAGRIICGAFLFLRL